MKETIKEIIENSFMQCTGTNEAIDDASFFIDAFINRKNKRQRLIESIENKLYLVNNDLEISSYRKLMFFLFEYKNCKNIHQIIEIKKKYENAYFLIDLFLLS